MSGAGKNGRQAGSRRSSRRCSSGARSMRTTSCSGAGCSGWRSSSLPPAGSVASSWGWRSGYIAIWRLAWHSTARKPGRIRSCISWAHRWGHRRIRLARSGRTGRCRRSIHMCCARGAISRLSICCAPICAIAGRCASITLWRYCVCGGFPMAKVPTKARMLPIRCTTCWRSLRWRVSASDVW